MFVHNLAVLASLACYQTFFSGPEYGRMSQNRRRLGLRLRPRWDLSAVRKLLAGSEGGPPGKGHGKERKKKRGKKENGARKELQGLREIDAPVQDCFVHSVTVLHVPSLGHVCIAHSTTSPSRTEQTPACLCL